MGNEQSNEARDEPSLETIENENVMTREQLRGIQSLFSTICETLQSTLSEMCQLKEEEDFVKMENIDLCQALKGTVFKTRLNKLWDIKLINQTINTGFSQLQCDHCDQQAKIASECPQETSYKLYCELHFEQFGSRIQPSINLKHSKKFNRIVLKELERHLIQVQERIDYFHIENDKKDPFMYEKVKGLIEEDFEQLKNLLESMTIKCSKLNKLKTKTKKMKYEYLSFIKDDCEKSRNTIFKILSMIPEVWNKIESDSLVQVIVNSRKGVPLEEEVKENITHSISDRVYEKEYKLIHIPTQSLKSFKKFENKIKNNCKITETCIEVF